MAEYPTSTLCIAFSGTNRLAAGTPGEVALAVKGALAADDRQQILVFDAVTSRPIDFEYAPSRPGTLERPK